MAGETMIRGRRSAADYCGGRDDEAEVRRVA